MGGTLKTFMALALSLLGVYELLNLLDDERARLLGRARACRVISSDARARSR